MSTDENSLSPDESSDLKARLVAVRPRLLAFARLQLSDQVYAEDMVQETLASALQSLHRFRGQSQFETWVFGILRHKLVDAIRLRGRDVVAEHNPNELPEVDEMFDSHAHWALGARPQSWVQPEESCDNDRFWEVFDICVFHLPKSGAQVFTLRELMGLETEEICDCLEISEQNCWVILHRARLKLRACLEAGWFSKEGDDR
ncbi:sigma-70 family RNA polymerase sigma factor [Marinobacterium lutimaris]|uniref:RNA polymerase sigma-70 factor, ECF subfamily n=1 Tax=Marinobacterium lutimaris TaxID=568106 RepID=A0A1H6C6K4_9GAMM|nr:sigma-70 family RNA polymerase sigma factor [Marinobacterium lutimaris]SEG68599.1 RNA polymerase sigma-70 factor, ECF subfamily [Marinobacterium lutimaris]